MLEKVGKKGHLKTYYFSCFVVLLYYCRECGHHALKIADIVYPLHVLFNLRQFAAPLSRAAITGCETKNFFYITAKKISEIIRGIRFYNAPYTSNAKVEVSL